jgi:hypothetical protein
MPFELGKNLHLIHIGEDYQEMSAWYADVFDGLAGWVHSPEHFPYLDVEIRYAEMIIIGDCCVEPMSPAKEVDGWDRAPVGRFLNKFGSRWQTLSWYTEGVVDLYKHLQERGTRFYLLGGDHGDDGLEGLDPVVFTHPRDTYGGLEFSAHEDKRRPPRPPHRDPRFYPGFDPLWWAKNHPLGVRRLGYTTLVVDDLDKATEFYRNGLNGKVIDTNTDAVTGTRNVYLSLGAESVVELALPSGADSLAARDLQQHGPMFHAVTWNVVDLDRARGHLEDKGVEILEAGEHMLIADPKTTFGAVHRFTTWTPNGDPRD